MKERNNLGFAPRGMILRRGEMEEKPWDDSGLILPGMVSAFEVFRNVEVSSLLFVLIKIHKFTLAARSCYVYSI